jgi:CO/xanthine dehydrogenase FAD-binding subunit
MLPEFEFLRPRTLPEALAMLATQAPDVIPLAGGTNLIVELRDGHVRPRKLMDISRLRELRGIRRDNGHIIIGGGTTITELLTDPLIAELGLPLQQAAGKLGNPLVRNRATVAGNLANASPAADTAPPLLALDAEVELAGMNGTRSMPLHEFIVDVNKTLRRPDELVVSLRWPVPPARSAAGFYKIGLRKADACSVINAAAMVIWDESGNCLQARIAIGAAAPRPVRARDAEAALLARPLNPGSIEEAAHFAVNSTQPIDDIRGSAVYRKRMAEVMVRRLLTQIAECQAGRREKS